MDFPEKSPTLLVFTLGAQCESRRRRLLPAKLNPVEDCFHQACLETTLAAGREAGCRLEVSSPLSLVLPKDVELREQIGADFGARLRRAAAKAFEHGGPVLLVGSDVPDLEESHLRRTLSALEDNPEQVVIGPSPDGGLYLLAAARPLDNVLADVRWQCRQTLQSLKRALQREGRKFLLLPPLRDLDHRSDLESWLAMAAHRASGALRGFSEGYRLIAQLIELLAELRRPGSGDAFRTPSRYTTLTLSLRGPPAPAL